MGGGGIILKTYLPYDPHKARPFLCQPLPPLNTIFRAPDSQNPPIPQPAQRNPPPHPRMVPPSFEAYGEVRAREDEN